MRDYAKVLPEFWTGTTGKAMRGDPKTQLVAMYLITSPHANMTGLYHLPLAYLTNDTGLSSEDASKALARLYEGEFCSYDEASEVVFVRELARINVGETLSPKDNRHKGIIRELDRYRKCPLIKEFWNRYRGPFNLPEQSPYEAPCKPLRSQEQEQEQEQEIQRAHAREGFSPPPNLDGAPKDPLADHMNGRGPGHREDVQQVYEAWKLAVDRPNAKLRGGRDLDAVTIAEAIDAHGLEDCLRVAKYAPNDGMVTGKLDEKGREHKSVKYIFGNTDAFQRILHAARDRDRKTSRKRSAREVREELSKL